MAYVEVTDVLVVKGRGTIIRVAGAKLGTIGLKDTLVTVNGQEFYIAAFETGAPSYDGVGIQLRTTTVSPVKGDRLWVQPGELRKSQKEMLEAWRDLRDAHAMMQELEKQIPLDSSLLRTAMGVFQDAQQIFRDRWKSLDKIVNEDAE